MEALREYHFMRESRFGFIDPSDIDPAVFVRAFIGKFRALIVGSVMLNLHQTRRGNQ